MAPDGSTISFRVICCSTENVKVLYDALNLNGSRGFAQFRNGGMGKYEIIKFNPISIEEALDLDFEI
jgi:hypothetical protein